MQDTFIPENNENIREIVNKLYKFGYIKTNELVEFREYKDEIESKLCQAKFMMKVSDKPEKVKPLLDELQEELDWLNQTTIYRNSNTSLLVMNGLTYHLWMKAGKSYEDGFFDFKKLVELINDYFEIENPYKAPNKIAYGWNFSLKKGFEAFRPYLYGCIRNYLNRNGVEFKTIELQKICHLRDCENGDE